MVLNQGSNGLGYGLTLTVAGLNQATGNGGGLSITPTITPTSGTAVFNLFNVSPTINQTGGANGITRGLYVNPTITAAADWRAIETTAGNVIFNGGNVGIGTASPSARLHIVGTGTTNATTTFVSQNSANTVNGTIYNDGTWFFGGANTRLVAAPGQFDFTTASGNIVRLGQWEVFLRPLQYTSSLELSTNIRLLGGNVLVNTSTDTGLYKLDVNGTARVTGTMTVVKSGDAFVVNNGSGLEKFKVTDNGVADNSYAFLRRTTNAGDMFQVFYPAGTISSTNPTWNFGMNANSADFVIAYWGGAAVKNSMIFKTTGQSRFVPLVSAPSGAEAGDVYYDSTLNALSVYNGSAWVALGSGGGGGSMAIGGAITSATAGSVLFAGSGGVLQQNNANFFWDNTNSRLGIGTTTPLSPLHVVGSVIALRATLANGDGGVISNDSTTTYFQALTSVNDARDFNISGKELIFRSGSSSYLERIRITAAGRLLLGTTTEGTQLLQVNGDAFIKGSGATSGTNALTINNSSNTSLFYIRNDGFARFESGLSVYNSISFLNDTIVGSRQNNYLSINLPRIRIGGATAGFTTGTIVSLEGGYTAESGVGRGTYLLQNITASANNDVLVGLDIAPTFTNGAFTGVSNVGLRVLSNVAFGAIGTGMYWDNTNGRLGIGTNTPRTNKFLDILYNVPTAGGAGFGVRNSNASGYSELVFDNDTTPDASGAFVFGYGGTTTVNPNHAYFWNRRNAPILFGTNGLERVRITGAGRLLLGTITESSYLLDINGSARTKFATGYNNTTTDGGLVLTSSNDGNVALGVTTDLALRIKTNSIGAVFTSTDGQIWITGTRIYAFNSTGILINSNITDTTGTNGSLTVNNTVNYVNISHVYNAQTINPTITGLAGGVARGLYINPTLTAAADWRSIETSNNTGWSYYGAGTANSFFGGRVGIGTTTPLDFNLVVQGSLQVRGSANSFTGLLIQQDFIRRRDTGTFSLGSNDVATAIHMYASNNVGIGTSSDAGYKFDVNGTARIGTTPFADTSSSLIIGGTGNAQRGSVTGPGNYQDFMFVNTNIASGNINTWSFGQRRDTFFGNQLGSFQIVGGYINNTGATSAVGGGYRVPIICNPDGGVIIAGASANAINGDVAIGTATFGTATKVTIGGSETASSAIARGGLLNTTLVAAANDDVLVGLDINPTFTNGAFTGIANWGIRNYSSIRFETPNGSSNQGLYWTPAQDATQVRVFASNYSVTGFNTLNAMSGQDGLVVNGNERKLTINAAASSIYLDTSNIIISSHGSGEAMRIVSATKNVLIGLTTDAGYKLDVSGEIRSSSRVLSGLGGFINNCLYTYISNHCGSSGYIGFGFQNVTNPSASDSVFDIYQGPVSTPIANLFNIKHALLNASVAQAQAILGITTTINQSATATGDIRGIHYNPTVTNVIGNHYAWESTSGKFKISDLSGSGTRMVVADSTGVLSTQAIPSGGSSAYTVASVSTTYSETATSGTKIIKATTAGGTFVITLPTAVGNTATLIIKKTAGSADLTIDGAGTETIDGGLTAILRRVDESITLVSDNVNWLII